MTSLMLSDLFTYHGSAAISDDVSKDDNFYLFFWDRCFAALEEIGEIGEKIVFTLILMVDVNKCKDEAK